MHDLFNKWAEIEKRLGSKYLFVCLDFDGTLAPLAKTPAQAMLSQRIRLLLEKMCRSQEVRLAFISGRTLEDLKNKIRLANVFYSGNHGLEIEGPKIKFKLPVPAGYRRILDEIKRKLACELSALRGVILEDKKLLLSVHYRLAARKQASRIKNIFYEAVRAHLARNKIRISFGKMLLEVRPPVQWDKGKAVLWLLSKRIFPAKRRDILPVYIGDDITDEDAFKALKKAGLTIFVGKGRNSSAEYYLNNTGEVYKFLSKIHRFRKEDNG